MKAIPEKKYTPKFFKLKKNYRINIDGLPYWTTEETVVSGWRSPYYLTKKQKREEAQEKRDKVKVKRTVT